MVVVCAGAGEKCCWREDWKFKRRESQVCSLEILVNQDPHLGPWGKYLYIKFINQLNRFINLYFFTFWKWYFKFPGVLKANFTFPSVSFACCLSCTSFSECNFAVVIQLDQSKAVINSVCPHTSFCLYLIPSKTMLFLPITSENSCFDL